MATNQTLLTPENSSHALHAVSHRADAAAPGPVPRPQTALPSQQCLPVTRPRGLRAHPLWAAESCDVAEAGVGALAPLPCFWQRSSHFPWGSCSVQRPISCPAPATSAAAAAPWPAPPCSPRWLWSLSTHRRLHRRQRV